MNSRTIVYVRPADASPLVSTIEFDADSNEITWADASATTSKDRAMLRAAANRAYENGDKYFEYNCDEYYTYRKTFTDPVVTRLPDCA